MMGRLPPPRHASFKPATAECGPALLCMRIAQYESLASNASYVVGGH